MVDMRSFEPIFRSFIDGLDDKDGIDGFDSAPSFPGFPLRLKIPLPKDRALSANSRDGLLLVDERCEDLLERISGPSSQDGLSDATESSEEDFDEAVCWLKWRSRKDCRFNCLLTARIRSGDGGPSMAGSIASVEKLLLGVEGAVSEVTSAKADNASVDAARRACKWLNMALVQLGRDE